MTKQTKIMTGLLAGAALGAGIALILSSDKNSDLKDKFTHWLSDLMESSKDKITEVKDMAKQAASKIIE